MPEDPIFDDVEEPKDDEALEADENGQAEDDTEPKDESSSKDGEEPSKPVENPFGEDDSKTRKIISQKYEIKQLTTRLKELEAEKAPSIPDKSPMEQWAEENPDEEYAPAAIVAKENKYWRDRDRQEAQAKTTDKPVDHMAEIESAIQKDEPSALALQLANQYISDDEFAEVRERIADMPVDEAVQFVNRVAAWAIQERGSDLNKGVYANIIGSKASEPNTDAPKDTESEGAKPGKTGDDVLDFEGFDDIGDDSPSILDFK